MDAEDIGAALEDVFDQALVFHAFTDYMRDYEVITYSVADPITEIPPVYERFLFKLCVEAEIATTVSPEVWRRSVDDRLVDFEAGKDLDGYHWGVKWHCLYPGGKVVPNSERARRWFEAIGVPFHEARIETNAHVINLVFADLEVTTVEPGHAPYVVARDDRSVPPTPLT